MFALALKLAVFASISVFGAQALRGVTVHGSWTGFVIAVLFSILNTILAVPLMKAVLFLGTPLTILTLGLFALAVPIAMNAALLRGLSFLIGQDRFQIDGWRPALMMGLLFAIGQGVVAVLT